MGERGQSILRNANGIEFDHSLIMVDHVQSDIMFDLSFITIPLLNSSDK